MSAKKLCPICGVRPRALISDWCVPCDNAAPTVETMAQAAEWAARRARASLIANARRHTHAMNINVVGALVELRDAVLNAPPRGVALDDLRRLARRAQGKPIEPVAEVEKRARAAGKRGAK